MVLLDQSQIISQLKNLVGNLDLESCLEHASFLAKNLPRAFFSLSLMGESEKQEDYEQKFRDQRWEIPMTPEQVQAQRIAFLDIQDLQARNMKCFYLDLRTQAQFQKECIQNSLFLNADA